MFVNTMFVNTMALPVWAWAYPLLTHISHISMWHCTQHGDPVLQLVPLPCFIDEDPPVTIAT